MLVKLTPLLTLTLEILGRPEPGCRTAVWYSNTDVQQYPMHLVDHHRGQRLLLVLHRQARERAASACGAGSVEPSATC
ncbi:hypothetical protein [Nonomuraea insulae]